jgi:hypothetical protein
MEVAPRVEMDMDTSAPAIEKVHVEHTKPVHASRLKRWTGMALIALSFILYGGLLLVPMVPFSDKGKVAISALLVISGEASFWIGAFILGKEAVSKFRSINIRDWISRLLNRNQP